MSLRMKQRPSTRERKNPLHPSALSINDLTVGRRVIIFNRHVGITDEGIVMSRPRAMIRQSLLAIYYPARPLEIDIRSTADGQVRTHLLTAVGVVPDLRWGWSPVNFVIDHRKRPLLPEPIGFPDDFFDDLYGEEMGEEG